MNCRFDIMNANDAIAFTSLFKEACAKCFGHPLQTALTETESKQFSNQVLEQTGLVIGWKSIKNYSFYVLDDPAGKKENPSMATLDTLARYILSAPYTDEIQRKNKEGHFPWWFRYKEQYYQGAPQPMVNKKSVVIMVVIVIVLAAGILSILLYFFKSNPATRFTDDFHALQNDSLKAHGWQVVSKEAAFWNQRNRRAGHLTLFTLQGDSWPDPAAHAGIKNLLIRKITADCFTAEVHLSDFVPSQNWQQAGIILLEDTNLTGKSVRFSLMYNDFSGGAPVERHLLVQAITASGNGFDKPEEIAHKNLFQPGQDANSVITSNLVHSALRIEKTGNRLRLLYANGAMQNSAFKEVVTHTFDFKPAYIGLFALKGFVNNAADMPVYFKSFSLVNTTCGE